MTIPETSAKIELDSIDRKLLNIIQSDFPITPRPYKILGEHVDISENEAWQRVINLRKKGFIRRLGANFDSKKLGFKSTLCAAKVPEEKLDFFTSEVNSYKEVTHNYLRDNVYNVWFTFIGSSWEYVCNSLDAITTKTGIDILNLPASRMYKIKVEFSMDVS